MRESGNTVAGSSGGSTGGGAPGKGALVPYAFGGDSNTLDNFMRFNGVAGDSGYATRGSGTDQVIPFDGVIEFVSVKTHAGDSTMALTVCLDGAEQGTFNPIASGTEGFTTLSVGNSAGQQLCVKYKGGNSTSWNTVIVYVRES